MCCEGKAHTVLYGMHPLYWWNWMEVYSEQQWIDLSVCWPLRWAPLLPAFHPTQHFKAAHRNCMLYFYRPPVHFYEALCYAYECNVFELHVACICFSTVGCYGFMSNKSNSEGGQNIIQCESFSMHELSSRIKDPAVHACCPLTCRLHWAVLL